MSKRFLFYSAFSICIVSLITYFQLELNTIDREKQKKENSQNVERKEMLQIYLAKQTDVHKLISLSKKIKGDTLAINEVNGKIEELIVGEFVVSPLD